MLHAVRVRWIALAAASLCLAACSGGGGGDGGAKTLTTLRVQPDAAAALTVPLGTPLQFTAIGTYDDGSTADLTSRVSWASSDGTVAAVSNDFSSAGLASSFASGTTEVSATDAATGVHAAVTLQVTDAVLVSLAVAPIDPTLLVGTTLQLQAVGFLSDDTTSELTAGMTWTSSDETVATVSATGLVTALAEGTTTVTATDPVGGESATTTVQATTLPAVLSYLSLSRGSVVGGGAVQVTGSVMLTSPATEPVTVSLSSNSAAVTVPESVVVAAGAASATFPVTTTAVTRKTRATLTATDGTFTKTATLNVRIAR